MQVIKKDGTLEEYNEQKIINAINKSANRALYNFTPKDYEQICNTVFEEINSESFDDDEVPISFIHSVVEKTLLELFPDVGRCYQQYRNYKLDFVHMMDEVYEKSQSIMYIGDKDNANTDSALVATKRSLIFNVLNKELYKRFFMTKEELQACNDGYIYIHDMSARRDTFNCFGRETKFITNRGVRSFYDFQDGEEIVVLTHKGNWKKAIVKNYGYQNLQKIKFKRANGTIKEVNCTKNHRWLLKDGSETTNLKVGDKLIAAPEITNIDWNNSTQLEKLLWCIGFGIADGSIIKDNNIPTMLIRLCGHKVEFSKRFEDCGYIVTYPDSLNGDGFVRLNNIHDKKIPWLIINHNNIKYLIDGWLSADGHIGLYKNSKYRGLQVTGGANEYIYDLLNVSGYYVTNTTDLTDQKTNYGVRTSKTICYGFHSNQNDRTWFVESIEPAYINGNSKVWCLEVEDDHSFILENGIPTGNCCLFNMSNVMHGGFEMGNVWYNEPNSLDTAFDVMGDIILATAAQQYGGFTVPEVDKILEPYAEKSYWKYRKEYADICGYIENDNNIKILDTNCAEEYAINKVKRDFEQGWQGIEYKLNTVGSSRGDYPFVTMSLGLATSRFGKMAAITLLNVHAEGQGKKGFKRPVLFPKIVFLYDKELYGDGSEKYPNADVFNVGIACSSKTMYPDWLSLTGDGYVAEMYKKYKKVVSPMGKCKSAHVKRYSTVA